jgi:hypothetical protein
MLIRNSLLATVILSLLLSLGCREAEPIPPGPPAQDQRETWQEVAGFQSSHRPSLRAAVSDNGLLILTPRSISAITSDHSVFHISRPAVQDETPVPFHRDFFPFFDDRKRSIVFFSSLRPTNDVARFTLPYDSLKPDIVGLPPFVWRNLMATNDTGQMIIPMIHSNGEISLYHFEVERADVLGNGERWVQDVSYRRLPVSDLQGIGFIQGIGDGFLMSIHQDGQNKTIRVQHDGSLLPVLDDMFSYLVFPVEGSWYGWTTSDQSLYVSHDLGQSWQPLNQSLEQPSLEDVFAFGQVQNQTILYDAQGLYMIEKDHSGSLSVSLLDTQGLDGTGLVSLHPWEGKVYVCTHAGVFRKSLEGFFQIEPE